MKVITLNPAAGFDEWRVHARGCLIENLPPHDILWGAGAEQAQDLFAGAVPGPVSCTPPQSFTISKEFRDLAAIAAHHRDPARFALLYRILWRLRHENKNLLRLKTDDDILKLHAFVKTVRRDAYKIKAFLRFREAKTEQGAHFMAWYEPEHYTLELSLPFFQTRFRNMTWSILTPYLAAHWDQHDLVLHPNPDPSQYPKDDEIETYWLKYYATTFNPARLKKQAMLNQMPKKYWKNMPESILINEMVRNANARTRTMLDAGKESSGEQG